MPKTDLMAELAREIQQRAETRASELWRNTSGALWERLREEAGPMARWPFEREFNALKALAIPAMTEQIAEHMRKQALARLADSLLPGDKEPF